MTTETNKVLPHKMLSRNNEVTRLQWLNFDNGVCVILKNRTRMNRDVFRRFRGAPFKTLRLGLNEDTISYVVLFVQEMLQGDIPVPFICLVETAQKNEYLITPLQNELRCNYLVVDMDKDGAAEIADEIFNGARISMSKYQLLLLSQKKFL
jgi:hypothetical protein